MRLVTWLFKSSNRLEPIGSSNVMGINPVAVRFTSSDHTSTNPDGSNKIDEYDFAVFPTNAPGPDGSWSQKFTRGRNDVVNISGNEYEFADLIGWLNHPSYGFMFVRGKSALNGVAPWGTGMQFIDGVTTILPSNVTHFIPEN